MQFIRVISSHSNTLCESAAIKPELIYKQSPYVMQALGPAAWFGYGFVVGAFLVAGDVLAPVVVAAKSSFRT